MLVAMIVAMCLMLHGSNAVAALADPCSSSVSTAGGSWLLCPSGDGMTLEEIGATIDVTVRDYSGVPIHGIPAADFWMVGCNDNLVLCGGSSSINADAASDENGHTTISGTAFAGGSDTAIYVVVQGLIIGAGCDVYVGCVPIAVHSVDVNRDLSVDSTDEALFMAAYTSPPHAYNFDLDFDNNGVIDLADLVILHRHAGHGCF
jgi:hypothetical protein